MLEHLTGKVTQKERPAGRSFCVGSFCQSLCGARGFSPCDIAPEKDDGGRKVHGGKDGAGDDEEGKGGAYLARKDHEHEDEQDENGYRARRARRKPRQNPAASPRRRHIKWPCAPTA